MSRMAAMTAVVVTGLLFSTGGAAVKITAWGAWQIAASRSAIAAVVLFACLPEARRSLRWSCLPVGLAYAATLVLFVHANKQTTAAATIFLQATSPLYVLFLGPLLLKEKLRRADLVLLPVFLVGLIVLLQSVVQPSGTAPNPALGNLLAGLSGLSYALTVVGIRALTVSKTQEEGAGAAAVAVGNVLAAILCLPWAIPLESGGPTDLGVVLFLGAFQIAFAYILLLRAVRVLTALEIALLLLLEPVLSPLWAWGLHGEVPGLGVLLGGALIVGATLLKTASETLAPPPSET